MKAVKRIVSQLMSAFLFLLLTGMILLVVSTNVSGGDPEIFGYQFKTVLSGSMEPGIQTGSVIAVQPGGDMTRFEQGDVITFKMDEQTLVTHRVIERKTSGEHVMYTTKGDNNQSADSSPVLSENVSASYTGFTVPYIGYLIEYAKSKEGNALLFIVPGLLLIGYSILTIWKAVARLEEPKNA
ncbi:signal peptidase I SipW [Metabacillus sp. 84]|uniref:signal peptidase I SipW n=1 Tax=unclassified Metabacillus TaxID=2675274 RepID=UPI003CF7FB98